MNVNPFQATVRGHDPYLELRGPGRAGQPGPHHHHLRSELVSRAFYSLAFADFLLTSNFLKSIIFTVKE